MNQKQKAGLFQLFYYINKIKRNLLMPNKTRGSELWSEIIQVSVTPEIKDQIVQIADETKTSQSNVVRDLLDQALEKEPSVDD
jgi:hypothetical protein